MRVHGMCVYEDFEDGGDPDVVREKVASRLSASSLWLWGAVDPSEIKMDKMGWEFTRELPART